jgi:hypothetical protein
VMVASLPGVGLAGRLPLGSSKPAAPFVVATGTLAFQNNFELAVVGELYRFIVRPPCQSVLLVMSTHRFGQAVCSS